MFEIKVLFAFGIGIGAGLVALAPAVSAVTGCNKLSRDMVDSGRNLTKFGLKMGVILVDKVSEVATTTVRNISDLGESLNDLVAEARADVVQDRFKSSNNDVSIDKFTEVTVEG